MSELIRVAFVDDHPVVRAGAVATLDELDDIEVVDSVETLAASRELLAREPLPDVLVVDIRLPDGSGLALLAGDGETGAGCAIVVWTGYDFPQFAAYASKAGAAGFVPKTAPVAELVAAIRAAAAGGEYFHAPQGSDAIRLTPRERQVVRHLIAGWSNDEIAARLHISRRAVEGHLTSVYKRFGIAARVELATRATREGWLDIPTPPDPPPG